MRTPVAATLATGLLLGATACGTSDGGDSGAPADGKLSVVTSFYPLQLAVSEIGGEHVSASNLVKPGTEPHDLELTPKDVAKVTDADLLVYLKGFTGAVDDAAKNQAGGHAYDVSSSAKLDLKAPEEGEGHEGHDHGDEGKGDDHEGHDHGPNDPHFWLDPVRYASVATAIGQRLAKADPEHRSVYLKNAKAFSARLTKLNTELTTGLRSCQRKDLITSHAAFGYLAQRIGMKQVPIAGVSPSQAPDAATLTKISDLAKKTGTTTIYTETLASPRFAEAIARSSNAKTAVLDPVEGVTKASPGTDYFEIMRANLKTLRSGQGCS
jgi:zinc transport system substrate-binding protein